MSYDLVVRGGTIVTATDRFPGDIGVRAGRIVTIGDALPRGEREVDARGLQVLPGGIDVHTHLDIDLGGMRSIDDFESGTAAAACGGVTTICDYAWQEKGWSLAKTVEAWKARAHERAHIDYAFHVVVNDVDEARLAEIPRLAASGYPSFKVFMIKEFGISDAALLRVLRASRDAGAVVNIHAENSEMLDLAVGDMLAAGRWDPPLLRGQPARARGGRGHAAGHRLRRAGGRRGLHRPHVLPRRGRGGARGATARPPRLG